MPPMNASLAAPVAAIPWGELVSHRTYLVRFAQRRLHDPMLAEDLVHDVFEAVLSGRALFAGRSALRSWLTGILKHKVVDLIRQRAGTVHLDEGDDDNDDPGTPCHLPRPDERAEQRERLNRTLAKIEALPAGLRDVMHVRVLQDETTDAACRTLGISQDNLFVRLHRARRLLLS